MENENNKIVTRTSCTLRWEKMGHALSGARGRRRKRNFKSIKKQVLLQPLLYQGLQPVPLPHDKLDQKRERHMSPALVGSDWAAQSSN